ncbi:MAG: GyrI-like domain-containing protein, partial [Actinobacteria bacterium]|nr:GyrI-like domain-containing protein [Actinomycetota bacterium]
AHTTQQRLGSDITRLLGGIWPVLREQGVRTGHNVVIYHNSEGVCSDCGRPSNGEDAPLSIDLGVETFSEFTGSGEIGVVATPAGEVITVAHYGDYAKMAQGYTALEQWCTDNGREKTGLVWEVYGDWDNDPAKVRTDIYFQLKPASAAG